MHINHSTSAATGIDPRQLQGTRMARCWFSVSGTNEPHDDAAENGVVTLSGHVTDCSQKVAVERAVRSAQSVRNIVDNLVIG